MGAVEQLQLLVDSLSETELKKLAAKVELDRGAQQLGLPHNAIMQLLRPSLALIRAPRVHHPQRIFCMPFEDMLINGKPEPKPTGKIDRSTITAMWSWFSNELATKELPPLKKGYINAQREGDDEAAHAVALKLWDLGATKITEALSGIDQSDKELRKFSKKFGGESRLNDVIEMAGALRVAAVLEEVKTHLRSKPIMELTEPEILAIKRGYSTIADEQPGDELYFLLAIMGRLLRSPSIFQILRTLSRKGDDALLQKTEMGKIGDIVIRQLEDIAAKVGRGHAKGEFNEDAVVEDIYFFSSGFREITRSIGITRGGEWGQRMYKARSAISDAIDRKFLENAEQLIMQALPTKPGGLVPKLSDWPSDHDFEVAERRARAINKVNAISFHIGNQSACQNLIHKMQRHFDNYTTGILKAIPAAPEEMKDICHAYVCVATRLIELIHGPDEADILRRRGNAAIRNTTVD